MTNFLNRKEVDSILEDLHGQVVTVNFIKKDGSARKLNGQLVASPGSHNGYSDLFTIALANTSKDNKGFRSASRDKITRIAGKGLVYAVRGNLDGLI
jgi:hypothetical protein